MRLLTLKTFNSKQKNNPSSCAFGLPMYGRRQSERRRAARRQTMLAGKPFADMKNYAGSFNHSLSGKRLIGLPYGRRARIFAALPTVANYRYQARHAIWWKAQTWRKNLYASIQRPESLAKAATYANLTRSPSVIRNHRYTLATKNRGALTETSKFKTMGGADIARELHAFSIFTKPYTHRVHFELAKMDFLARKKALVNPTFTPTIRRYLERMWRIRFRLRFEKFFFKRTGCRTYVWLQSTFRGLRLSYKRRFRETAAIAANKNNRRLAAYWRWSTYQMSVFQSGMTMMMTLPGNLEMPFITLRRLMRKHRSHFSVIRFFVTYIHKAISKRRLDALYNFRMRIAGKFVGELKRRVCLVGHGEMRLARYEIPADFYTTVIPTKYGIFGLKYWVQIFPTDRWFDELMHPTQVVAYEDRILDEDLKNPGWTVFEQDELVAQWFFSEVLEEYRHVTDPSRITKVNAKTPQELGTLNRPEDYKILEEVTENDITKAKTRFEFKGMAPKLVDVRTVYAE